MAQLAEAQGKEDMAAVRRAAAVGLGTGARVW